MATPAYEAGIGGKLRRKTPRRAPATPYDRPPAAVRGLRARLLAAEAGGGSSWLSKLVDPASRFIASSASRIFSSVFRKRLPAPPAAAREGHYSRQEGPEAACTNLSPEIPENGACHEDPANNSDTKGISELEQLLKQKTFTRVEFDRLTELLRSRTVVPDIPKSSISNENMNGINASAQDDGIAGPRSHRDFSTPPDSLPVPEDEAASPAELAKAYMGSRSLKVSSSARSLRRQVFHEDKTILSKEPYATKPIDQSVVPRSVVRISGTSETPENGYVTPRPRGRSAMYRMSRSPYFKPTSVKLEGLPKDGYGPSSSQQTQTAFHSGGRQALKRGGSVLDNDYGSFGPIRRIRQKSKLMSPSREMYSVRSGNLLPGPSTPLDEEVIQGSTSIQKPIRLVEPTNGLTNLQNAEYGDNKLAYGCIAPIPPQSTETARRIFQQLDNLVSSPKEKSPELASNKSPSKSTDTMLHGQAPGTMVEVNSSKLLNVQGRGNLGYISYSALPELRSSLSQKQDRVKGNGPDKAAVSGVKLASQATRVENAAIRTTDPMAGKSTGEVFTGSAAVPSQKQPSFRMSAPEDPLDLDDDDNNVGDASGPEKPVNVKVEGKISEQMASISETAAPNKSFTSWESSSSTFMSSKEDDEKASVKPANAEKGNGFTFPATPAPGPYSQQCPTPTLPAPSLNGSVLQKEPTAASVFAFGSKDTNAFTVSSTTDATVVNDPAGRKSDSSIATSSTLFEGSSSDKGGHGGETQKASNLFKSFGTAVSANTLTSTTTVKFAFGASTTPTLSNGSLNSSSNLSVSAASTVTLSASPVTAIFSPCAATSTSSSSSSISSSAPVFSTIPTCKFGSTTSHGSSFSVFTPTGKSDTTDAEARVVDTRPVTASPFSISSFSAPSTSAMSSTGSSSSSGLAASSVFSSSANSSPALATSSVISSIGSSSAASTALTLISSVSASQSVLAPSLAFSSSGNSIFGFNASGQGSSSSLSAANTTSQTSAASSDTARGSLFGTQSTITGSGISPSPQVSASQFGSFSSPTFGLATSSSPGFGGSPFGSTTTSAKPFSSSSGFSFVAGAGSSSGGTSSSAAVAPFFSSSSRPSTSSVFGATFGSSAPSPSTGISFGLSTSVGGSSFTFGSSSASLFSFTSAGSTTSSSSFAPQPVFGAPTSVVGFSPGSTGNDQMHIEDSMADDTNQASVSMVSPFGQPNNLPAAPVFGSPAMPSGGAPVFQFGSHQNSAPFQANNNVEFAPGGSFSLGSGGGDKSGRKFVKVRRDKLRKK